MDYAHALQHYGTYLLVMIAVSLFIYISIRFIQSSATEHVEKGGGTRSALSPENGIYHFIDKIKLRQLQTSTGILAAGTLVGILLFCQVYNPAILVGCGGVSFAIAFQFPRIYFLRKAKKRAAEFESSILDLAMGLTSALRSGQALPQAIEAFSRRCNGPMKEELMVVIREYRLGLELSESLQRMYDRLPNEDLQLLIVSIKLTTQSGGSLADVIQKITQTIRSRTEFHQKLMALTAQGRFEALAMSLAPLAAFVLLLLVNTELMLPLLTTGTGWCAIAAMLALEVLGYMVIRKIVDIKV